MSFAASLQYGGTDIPLSDGVNVVGRKTLAIKDPKYGRFEHAAKSVFESVL